MAPFDFARALAAQTATAAAKLREADEAVRLEAAQKAATATKTREAEEAAHRAKQLQTLSNERAVITNEEAALEEVKQTMLADYNAKIAALKKRAVELDRQANGIVEQDSAVPKVTMAYRPSRESTIEAPANETPHACASPGAVGDFANVASRALQATASMENAQKSLGHTLATESGEEADDAQKGRHSLRPRPTIEHPQAAIKQPGGSNVGDRVELPEVIFAPDVHIVNADGAVAIPMDITTYAEADHYREMSFKLTHVVSVDGYLYALSCAISDCRANSPVAPHVDVEDTFFAGWTGLIDHCFNAHKVEMAATFGKAISVSVKSFGANKKFCRMTPITPRDLQMIITGRIPSSIGRHIGRVDEECAAASEKGTLSADVLPFEGKSSRRKRRSAEEDDGVFEGTRSKSPQKQGDTVGKTRFGRPTKRSWKTPPYPDLAVWQADADKLSNKSRKSRTKKVTIKPDSDLTE